jgi:hypothetical protein
LGAFDGFRSRRIYGISASLSLDIRGADHLAPLFGFVGDQLAEVGGRTGKHNAAQVGKPRFNLGIDEARVDILVELFDDLGGPPGSLLHARRELSSARARNICRLHHVLHDEFADLKPHIRPDAGPIELTASNITAWTIPITR